VLATSLSGVVAVSAHADGQNPGGSWSTSYENNTQPQPLGAIAYDAPVNVLGEVPDPQSLVTGVTASSGDENSGSESVQNLPTLTTSKWYRGRAPSAGSPIEATYTLSAAATVTSYRIMSANDDWQRAPKSWTVKGSNDGSSWTTVDTVSGFGWKITSNKTNNTTAWFDVDTPGSYTFYKLSITEVADGSQGKFQVSQWLLASAGGVGAADEPMSSITAVGTNFPNLNSTQESIASLWDRNAETKWYGASGNYPTAQAPVWVTYTFDSPQQLDSYTVTSANDSPERDPKTWTVLGTNDPAVAADPASSGWTQIDARGSELFDQRYQTKSYPLEFPGSYQYVQLRVTANRGDSTTADNNKKFQVAGWTLRTAGASTAASVLSTQARDASNVTGMDGSKGVRYAGVIPTSGAASSTQVLHRDLSIPVSSHTTFGYRINPSSDAGRAVALDLTYTDADGSHPARLSTTAGITDRGGLGVTAAEHASSLTVGTASTVQIDLGPLMGKTITGVLLDLDAPTAAAGPVSGWVDALTIGDDVSRGALDIYPGAVVGTTGNIQPQVLGRAFGATVAADPGAVAASIDLGDGSAPVDLDTQAGDDGTLSLSFPETFRFTKAGVYPATLTATSGGESVSVPLTIPVSTGDSGFQAAANMRCITTAGVAADCDGNGYAFDRARLANPTGDGETGVPFVQGGTGVVTVDGTDYHFVAPTANVAGDDTIIPDGQTWQVSPPTGTSTIVLIGMATENTQTRDLTLHYTDGSTQVVSASFGDWVGKANGPVDGNTLVVRTKGRLRVAGGDSQVAALYASTPITLDTDGAGAPKVLESIELPVMIPGKGQLHIQALGTDVVGPAPVTLDAPAAVTGYAGTVTPFNFGDVAGGGSISATISWGDGTDLANVVVTDEQFQAAHIYSYPGTYVAHATVANGFSSVTSDVEVTVRDRYASAVALTATPLQVAVGGDVALRADVTVPEDGDIVPDGSVVFRSGTTTVATVALVDGRADAVLNASTVGTSSVTAEYQGTYRYASATSDAVQVTAKNTTTTSLTAPSTTTFGQPAAFTVAVSPVTATGTVELVAGSTVVGSGTLAAGSATITTSTLPAGSQQVTARYLGDGQHLASTSTASTVVVRSSLANGDWSVSGPTGDQAVGATPTITVTLPSGVTDGSLSFTLDSAAPVVVPVTGSTTTWSTPALAMGQHTVAVSYDGGTLYLPTSTRTVGITVAGAASSTVVQLPSGSVTVGQSAVLTAKVTPTAATGTVTFFDGGTSLGTATLSGGTATFSTSALTVGSHAITATYGGDALYVGSTSSAATLTVVKVATTTTVSVPATGYASDTVTATASVAPAGVTGTVQFSVDGTAVGSAVTLASGQATATLGPLAVGSHQVTATYSGDATRAGSTSAAGTIAVAKKPTQLTASTPTPGLSVPVGTAVSIAGTLTPAAATGQLQLFVDGESHGAAVTLATAGGTTSATASVSDLPVGSHMLTLRYLGDATYAPSESTPSFTVVVTTIATSVAIDVPETATALAPVVLHATVTPAAATGQVQFMDGDEELGAPVTVTGGAATLTTEALGAGTHALTARFLGSTDYAGSESDARTLEVAKIVTTTALTGPGSAVTVGTPVVLAASVTPAGATGQVEVREGTTVLGTAALDESGTAAFSMPGLTVGTHALVAAYLGDGDRATSESATVTVTVQAAPVTAPVLAAPVYSALTQAYAAKGAKRVTVSTVVTGPTSGTVTFRVGGAVLGTAPVVAKGGRHVATLRVPGTLALGAYARATASMTVDGQTVTSAASAYTLRVVKAVTAKVVVKGKAFKAGSKAKIRVRVKKLSNGRQATGKVRVYVGKKVVTTVKLRGKDKGRITVTLPKRYTSTIKVKAKLVPKIKAIRSKASKRITLKARR